jgi:hypothetical protein
MQTMKVASSGMADRDTPLVAYSVGFRGSAEALRKAVEAKGGRMYVPAGQPWPKINEAVAVLPVGASLKLGFLKSDAAAEILSIHRFFLPY